MSSYNPLRSTSDSDNEDLKDERKLIFKSTKSEQRFKQRKISISPDGNLEVYATEHVDSDEDDDVEENNHLSSSVLEERNRLKYDNLSLFSNLRKNRHNDDDDNDTTTIKVKRNKPVVVKNDKESEDEDESEDEPEDEPEDNDIKNDVNDESEEENDEDSNDKNSKNYVYSSYRQEW